MFTQRNIIYAFITTALFVCVWRMGLHQPKFTSDKDKWSLTWMSGEHYEIESEYALTKTNYHYSWSCDNGYAVVNAKVRSIMAEFVSKTKPPTGYHYVLWGGQLSDQADISIPVVSDETGTGYLQLIGKIRWD